MIHALDISGGINNALPATEILPNQLSAGWNVDYAKCPQAATRRGYTKYRPTRFTDGAGTALRILGLNTFAYGAGTFRDIFLGLPSGGTVKLYYVIGDVATQVNWAASITPSGLAYPFSFAELRNSLIMVNGANPNASWNGDVARDAQSLGIETPVNAPVPATGAAGNLNGTYEWCYCYYDSTSDVYSAASPTSASHAVTNKIVQLSNMSVSGNPRVTHKKVYRRLVGAGVFYLVGTITNATTTLADNIADATLNSSYELQAGGQPDTCRLAVVFGGVVYLMNCPSGEKYARVYPSRPSRPEEFPATFQFDLGTGDGQQITGAWVVGNQLVVFKERSIWHVTGTSDTDRNTQIMNHRVGMKWPYAGIQIGSTIVFASEDGIWTWDTSRAEKIGDSKGTFPMQGVWDAIGNLQPGSNFGEEVRALWMETRRQVWWTYRTTNNSGPNERVICWNPMQPNKPFMLYDFGFDCDGEWRQNYSGKRTTMFSSRDCDGWIFKADNGNLDRCLDAGTMQGTVGTANATTMTIASGALYTTGEALKDAYLWVWNATTHAEQTVKIVSNTGTIITVAAWPSFTPVAGDSWAIGSIKTEFQSARLQLEQPNIDKEVYKVRIRMEAVA